ncbi:unnamed protein product [Rotaria socialis]|uniref:F-box domain-containing protein n=4 Tax=Rotaria socialis TaxID=392032 RepID=A0A818KB52_9BILA|nr:unnamed protein product [Rotaria socialis]CAF3332940.1 unnamed protein product [Rotaria socialis]CAF3394743.1 unnamed protein product [Rotaria socialis]CAF3455853.1 unnamed protein product [Rotaria socialis]CAF3553496.1 unnamed protein product [Rotaria socialis]
MEENDLYTESKSLSTVHCPPIKQSIVTKKNDKSPSPSRSFDFYGENAKRQKSCTQLTSRSVTIRWTEHSLGSHSTVPSRTSFEQLLHWFTNSWSEAEQNDFLRRLIVKFDERQQYFVSCVITQRRYRDFISLLPQSVVFEILKTLTLQELSRSREVCKNWKSIVDREPDLWKPKDETKTAEMDKTIQVDWEKVHKQNLATKRNWLAGTAQLIKCAGHKER